jgi:hypothetical protein
MRAEARLATRYPLTPTVLTRARCVRRSCPRSTWRSTAAPRLPAPCSPAPPAPAHCSSAPPSPAPRSSAPSSTGGMSGAVPLALGRGGLLCRLSAAHAPDALRHRSFRPYCAVSRRVYRACRRVQASRDRWTLPCRMCRICPLRTRSYTSLLRVSPLCLDEFLMRLTLQLKRELLPSLQRE